MMVKILLVLLFYLNEKIVSNQVNKPFYIDDSLKLKGLQPAVGRNRQGFSGG